MTAALAVPPGRALRVVGDVHGDAHAFAFAAETDHFLIQLGDLTDGGPDSAGVLRTMFQLIDESRGLFLLGNHDRKLARAIAGERVRISPELEATLDALTPTLRDRTLAEATRAPAWLLDGPLFFVHAAFHTSMLNQPAPPGLGRVDPLLSRALFGEVTGRTQPDGFPERLTRWIHHIPPTLTVYCGHDQRSRDGRPLTLRGDLGGHAVFLDTGAGKGGHLSWIDLPAPR